MIGSLRTRTPALALALGLWLLPELARACAVCGAVADEDGSRLAYIVTTAVLSILPLGVIGGFLLWVRRLHRQRVREASHAAR